ncbi:MAG: class I SAM-dependent methyltransferase [Actinomycetota bacterium]|nr:class I SAM-dependent methyltransferase [Actinomycetota bacterium]
MKGGFGGDVASYYAQYRRGYPVAVVDALVDTLGLSASDTIVDIGCGTGQLTLPLANRVGRAIGIDLEADMLRHADTAARERRTSNVEWILGSADDLVAIAAPYGGVEAVTLANSIHLVDRAQLFAAARTALSPRGSLSIIANGHPLWLQDTAWSHALKTFLERWSGITLTGHCGTDDETRSAYRHEMTAVGYVVEEVRVDYTDTLTLDQIVGGVFSALSARIPAAGDRNRFAADVARALADSAPYAEHVPVRVLIGHLR